MTHYSLVFANVIFDLDGTLTDPRQGFLNSISFALSSLGVEAPPPEELLCYIGPPIHGTFSTLLHTTDDDIIEQAVRLYRQRLGGEGIVENAVYPGVVDLLLGLREAGCQLFVATAKPLKFAIPILQHCEMHHYFTDFYGSELGAPNTPKAELIGSILKKWKVSPSDAAMIGDRRHDIEGAKATGVHAIGVTYGYGSIEELTAAGADVLCAHPNELAAYLMRDKTEEHHSRGRHIYEF